MRPARFLSRRSLGPLTILALLVAGCGDDDPAGPGDSFVANFTASVTGDAGGTLTGEAVFAVGTDPESGEQAWIVYLPTLSGQAFAGGQTAAFFGLGAPMEQSYVLEDITGSAEFPDGGAAGYVILFDGQNVTGIFGSTGGTFTITSLSETRLDGTFSMMATGTVFEGQEASDGSITVQGSFQAASGAFLGPFSS